jgi:hypothetical protein
MPVPEARGLGTGSPDPDLGAFEFVTALTANRRGSISDGRAPSTDRHAAEAARFSTGWLSLWASLSGG